MLAIAREVPGAVAQIEDIEADWVQVVDGSLAGS